MKKIKICLIGIVTLLMSQGLSGQGWEKYIDLTNALHVDTTATAQKFLTVLVSFLFNLYKAGIYIPAAHFWTKSGENIDSRFLSTTGVYFYQIQAENLILDSGKLIVK